MAVPLKCANCGEGHATTSIACPKKMAAIQKSKVAQAVVRARTPAVPKNAWAKKFVPTMEDFPQTLAAAAAVAPPQLKHTVQVSKPQAPVSQGASTTVRSRTKTTISHTRDKRNPGLRTGRNYDSLKRSDNTFEENHIRKQETYPSTQEDDGGSARCRQYANRVSSGRCADNGPFQGKPIHRSSVFVSNSSNQETSIIDPAYSIAPLMDCIYPDPPVCNTNCPVQDNIKTVPTLITSQTLTSQIYQHMSDPTGDTHVDPSQDQHSILTEPPVCYPKCPFQDAMNGFPTLQCAIKSQPSTYQHCSTITEATHVDPPQQQLGISAEPPVCYPTVLFRTT